MAALCQETIGDHSQVKRAQLSTLEENFKAALNCFYRMPLTEFQDQPINLEEIASHEVGNI